MSSTNLSQSTAPVSAPHTPQGGIFKPWGLRAGPDAIVQLIIGVWLLTAIWYGHRGEAPIVDWFASLGPWGITLCGVIALFLTLQAVVCLYRLTRLNG